MRGRLNGDPVGASKFPGKYDPGGVRKEGPLTGRVIPNVVRAAKFEEQGLVGRPKGGAVCGCTD